LIRLQDFSENDFNQLIHAIPDARFLLQWAGPKYTYPLDIAQLKNTLEKTDGAQLSFKVFKAIKADSPAAIGHIQLMDIDYNNSSCILGRVLVFSEFRGTGLAKELVNCAVEYAFLILGLQKITLGVFDFNQSAIATYQKIGFVEYQFNEGVRQFQNENWNVIKMKLYKNQWLHEEKC